mmetsp:Transcript_3690/g.8884  ORF Transcript_3690/g.8884 Transcript_3690/m.8884 type:complete len:212 (-) Transcript_3690:646-1281(-)
MSSGSFAGCSGWCGSGCTRRRTRASHRRPTRSTGGSSISTRSSRGCSSTTAPTGCRCRTPPPPAAAPRSRSSASTSSGGGTLTTPPTRGRRRMSFCSKTTTRRAACPPRRPTSSTSSARPRPSSARGSTGRRRCASSRRRTATGSSTPSRLGWRHKGNEIRRFSTIMPRGESGRRGAFKATCFGSSGRRMPPPSVAPSKAQAACTTRSSSR